MIDALLAAAAPALAVAFTLFGSPVTWLEVAAFWIAIAMVFANFRVNPVAWPLAIASSLMYGLLFAHSRLYGEAALQIVFVVVAFWGWWEWLRGTGADGAPLRVHHLGARARAAVVGATLAAWPLLGWLLDRFTDSDVPYLDALPTVGSLAGQFLLGRKLMENWIAWLLVSIVSVGLFAVKQLWLTVILYTLFTLLSWVGWRTWCRLERAA